jgi:hypothetical protein
VSTTASKGGQIQKRRTSNLHTMLYVIRFIYPPQSSANNNKKKTNKNKKTKEALKATSNESF